MPASVFIFSLVQSGLGSLASYLAAHVLLCLVPAFFIAGGLSALVPKEAITRFLGRNAPKIIAYPAAALAGSTLAVCSCTIVPLFAGIYKKGAGLGPAITFLFFAPAANILALTYTGVAIGAGFAMARFVLSLVFGIGIGLIMALIFRKSDIVHTQATDTAFAGQGGLNRSTLVFLLLLVVLLIAGTLKIPLLQNAYATFTVPLQGMDRVQDTLVQLVPFDATRGEEGVSVQGLLLIGLLALIGVTAWRGLGKVDEGYNRWTWTSLALTACTLIVAAAGMTATSHGIAVQITGKMLGVILAMLGIGYIARRYLDAYAVQQWLWESWRFVRQIFPWLIVGVFAVGVIRRFIQPEWVQAIAGSNSLSANLAAVVFGVFMYFPTLVEVPIARMFLSLGMHPGPLLAYLMADPELSLQSILITAAIIGRLKAWVYVLWVALFSAIAGLAYGALVDGATIAMVGLTLLLFLAVLLASLHALDWRSQRSIVARTQ